VKILVITKRQYMAKDLLDDRFGRFRELPLELAKLGHQVAGICFSYRSRKEGTFTDGAEGGGEVRWQSFNLGGLILPGIVEHARRCRAAVEAFRPDIIWAASDSFHAILGAWLGRRTRTKCVVDLYDNFESFGMTRLPGILPLFKSAVRSADGVTCVSRPLLDYVMRAYRPRGRACVLENGIRQDLFHPRDRCACREDLGLPENARIIGTAGALTRSRGIESLFGAFAKLGAENDSLHLALAGPRDRRTPIPDDKRIHYLGELPLERVPILINALDVAVVCNRDSLFGRYNFPQKAYEIIASGTAIVAAAVGSMKELLAAHPECLFEAESPESLARAMLRQLESPTTVDIRAPGWSEQAARLEQFFLQVLEAPS
jgi:teichuronic acid biosynthesis glycosyltransferase TuaC